MSKTTEAINNIKDMLDSVSGLDGCVGDIMTKLEYQVSSIVADIKMNHPNASLSDYYGVPQNKLCGNCIHCVSSKNRHQCSEIPDMFVKSDEDATGCALWEAPPDAEMVSQTASLSDCEDMFTQEVACRECKYYNPPYCTLNTDSCETEMWSKVDGNENGCSCFVRKEESTDNEFMEKLQNDSEM